MRRLIDWAQHASLEEIEQRYGRARHRLDQAIIDWLWHRGNRDASSILGLFRVVLTSDKSQILRDFEKHGIRKAEQRIKRMLLNAERSDARDAYQVRFIARKLQQLAIEQLSIPEQAVLKACIRRAEKARGLFAFGVRDAMIAATCNRYQGQKAIDRLKQLGFIVLQQEHVKSRKWARRWTLGDSLTVSLTDKSPDTASPYGGRGGCVRKLTTTALDVDPEMASAIYAQIGTDAHSMHSILCTFIEGVTVSAYAHEIRRSRSTARKWLVRLREFALADIQGKLWYGIQPSLVEWHKLYEKVNGTAARQRIEGQVLDERAAFEEKAASMDERDLLDPKVDELMKSGAFKDRRAAYRVARSAQSSRRRSQSSAHEHFGYESREAPQL